MFRELDQDIERFNPGAALVIPHCPRSTLLMSTLRRCSFTAAWPQLDYNSRIKTCIVDVLGAAKLVRIPVRDEKVKHLLSLMMQNLCSIV